LGIEFDGLGLIPWDWIEKAQREVLKEEIVEMMRRELRSL